MSIIVQQDATIYSLLYFSKLLALHVSGGNSTHHQEHIQLYSQHLALVKPSLLPSAVVEQLEQGKVAEAVRPVPDAVITVVCAPDDGWSYHPKHVERAVYRNIINCM